MLVSGLYVQICLVFMHITNNLLIQEIDSVPRLLPCQLDAVVKTITEVKKFRKHLLTVCPYHKSIVDVPKPHIRFQTSKLFKHLTLPGMRYDPGPLSLTGN